MNRKTKSIICAVISIIMVAMMGITAFAANEIEPNGNISTATPISVNEMVYGYATDGGDDDCYKFTTSSDGYIKVDVNKGYAEDWSMYLYLYNGNKKSEMYYFSASYEGIKDSTIKIGLPKGTYYIRVNGTYRSNYNFKVNFVSTNDWEKEFNETVVTANTVSVGKTFYGSTSDGGDYDWFKFTTTADGYMQISTTHDYGDYNTFSLYTYDGTEKKKVKYLQLSETSEKSALDGGYLKKGTYYLCVSGCSDTHYSFKINLSTTKPSNTTLTTNAPKPSNTQPSNIVTTTKVNQTTATVPPSSNTNNAIDDNDYVEYEDDGFYEYNDIVYYIENMNVYIYNYIGSGSEVYIPSDINGVPVTAICDDAFAGTSADVIHVPSSVTNIGANAFGQDDGEQRTVYGENGSDIMAYAEANDIAMGIDGEYSDSDYNEDYQEPADTSKIITIVVIIAVIAAVVAIIVVVIKKNKKEIN